MKMLRVYGFYEMGEGGGAGAAVNGKTKMKWKMTLRWVHLKGGTVDKFDYEMMWINGDRRTGGKGGGWEEERGWSGEDSLAYTGLVH